MTAARGKRGREPMAGQVFAVPLSDGSYGLAQVAHVKQASKDSYFVTCAWFPQRADDPEQLFQDIQEGRRDLRSPFLACTIPSDPITSGEWRLLGSLRPEYENVDIAARIKTTWEWFDGGQRPGELLLEMYHGLFPWNGLHDPEYLDKLLLPGHVRPPSARMKEEMEKA